MTVDYQWLGVGRMRFGLVLSGQTFYFLDYTAVDQDTAPTAVHTADKIKFLFIQNTSSADGIVICLDGGTAANDLADGIFIGPSETFCS